jgi:hypothetical protein
VTEYFLTGWHVSSGQQASAIPVHYLSHKRGAQEQARAAVLVSLRAFQTGYAKRDSAILPAFMEQLFPKDRDILVLGHRLGRMD